MDPETEARVERAVLEILRNADMREMTEFKVRQQASEELGIDLSEKIHRRFVRQVVESFLNDCEAQSRGNNAEPEPQKEKEVEDNTKKVGAKEYDDDGDLIICRLSDKRRVTIQDFRGKTLVSIREYYKKDGKEHPSSKGISLTAEQWSAFKKNVPAIETAIRKMESRLM